MHTFKNHHVATAILITCLISFSVRGEEPTSMSVVPQDDAKLGSQNIGPKGYLVKEIAGGVYLLTDGHYQMMFISTGKGVIAVDAPRSLGKKILTAIADVSDEPVTHVIYSHYHADHIGAAYVYPKGIEIIAQMETKGFLEEAGDPKRPLPTITFSDAYTITVADQTLNLYYTGSNHEVGNIIIYSSQQKVLMMVDIVWPGWVPFQSIGLADHIPGVIKAMDQLLTYDFDIYIGGHADRLGTRQDIELQKAYIIDLQQAAIQAYKEVDFNKLINDFGWEQRWSMFDNYFGQLSNNCSRKVVRKWKDKLKGAETFTPSNCKSIAFSIWMD